MRRMHPLLVHLSIAPVMVTQTASNYCLSHDTAVNVLTYALSAVSLGLNPQKSNCEDKGFIGASLDVARLLSEMPIIQQEYTRIRISS